MSRFHGCVTGMRDILHRMLNSLDRDRKAWKALLAMVGIYFFSYFLRSAIPGTIFDELQTEFSLTASAVAGLGAIFLGIYACTQLVAGMTADRFGGRSVLLWGGLIMTVGAIWFPCAKSVHALYAARALTGFGASFMFLSIVQEIPILFGHRLFPTVLGIVLFLGYLGNLTGTLPFALLVRTAGWRWALLGIGSLIALCLGASWCMMRRLPCQTGPRPPLSLAPLWKVIVSRGNRPMIVFSLTNFPVYFVMQTVIGKKFLQDVAGLRPESAASFTLIMAAVCAVLTFLGGFWLRLSRQRRKPVLHAFICSLLLGTVMLTLGVACRAPAFVFLIAFVLLAASVASSPVSSTIMKEANPPECVGQAVAVINAASYVGVSLLSWLSGVTLDRFATESRLTPDGRVYPPTAYLALFTLLTVSAVISAAAVMRIPETHPDAAEMPGPNSLEPGIGTGDTTL